MKKISTKFVPKADTFVAQGYSHYMCEDYALCDQRDGLPWNPSRRAFGVLSDGCSSTKNTDVGARLICYAARKLFRSHSGDHPPDYDQAAQSIMSRAAFTAESLGLGRECLHATLVLIYEWDDFVRVHFYGDGCLFAKGVDGQFYWLEVSFENEMPYYPLYKLDSQLQRCFLEHVGDKEVSIKHNARWNDWLRWTKVLHPQATHSLVFEFPMKDYSMFAISSDGMGSFLPKEQGAVAAPIRIPGEELLDFKSVAGDFLKRRAGKTLKRWKRQERPVDHYDDLSMCALLLEEASDVEA